MSEDHGDDPARHEARLLGDVFDQLSDAVVVFRPVLDAEGQLTDLEFVRCNREASRVYGRDDLVGRRYGEEFPGGGAAGILGGFRAVLATGRAHDVEVTGRERASRWYRARLMPVPGALALAFTDVTDQRRAAEDLRDREALFREAQAGTRIGSWSWQVGTDEARWSDELYEIMGRDRSLGPMSFDERLAATHPDDRAEFLATFRRALRHGDGYVLDQRIVQPDGRERIVRMRGRVVLDDAGTPARLVGLVQDVTEERALQARLLHVEKMESLGLLAGGIAHDFNNLLTVIAGHASLLRAGLAADDPRRDDVDAILGASERAAGLTSELLAFGRAQRLDLRVVELDALVTRLEPLLRGAVGERVRLRVATGAAPNVRVDPSRLEQVLVNLVLNAADAMPEGGDLLIETSDEPVAQPDGSRLPAGRYARIAVVDSGVGMDAETLARIFDPFFTTKPVGRGTGLGIPTAHGIVEQCGGRLSYESEPGAGTTATILLPAADEPPDDLDARDSRARVGAHGETVLLVEDARDVGAFTARVLRDFGYVVVEAADADEAERIARQLPAIDLLITDVVMPGVDGVELAERLRAGRPELRVLYVSGYSPDRAGAASGQSPRTSFVSKPFSVVELGLAARALLDESVGTG